MQISGNTSVKAWKEKEERGVEEYGLGGDGEETGTA